MAGTRVREVWSRRFSYYLFVFTFVLVLACHTLAAPSIANTSTGTINWVGSTTNNLTFSHAVSGTFRALLVGVSLQISNSTNATVGNITYGGSALSRVTFINQGTTRRVEIWRLTNPPVGTANVVLTLSNVGNNRNVGVVATAMTVIGVAVGAVFAAVAFAISVISFPLLLDRDVGAVSAIETSARAVMANPLQMAMWGLIVAVLLVLGSIPLFAGLAVVMPILGHATWHLYRKVVVRKTG